MLEYRRNTVKVAGADVTDAKDRELLVDGLVGLPEASTFTTLSKSSLYALMERGELAFVVIGRRRMIPRNALIELAKTGLHNRKK